MGAEQGERRMMTKEIEGSFPDDSLTDDCISREAAKDKLTKLINEIEAVFSDIREKNVDDSVCGLCEYDCDHGIDGYAYECPGYEKDDCFKLKDEYRKEWVDTSELPPVKPKERTGEWQQDIGPLTDTEQRIFLKAIERERDICRATDKAMPGEVNLERVCNSIERKVKSLLF